MTHPQTPRARGPGAGTEGAESEACRLVEAGLI